MINTQRTGILSMFGFYSEQQNCSVEILKQIDALLREMPEQLTEIETRADLSLPILKHVSDISVKIKEPILVLQSKMNNIKEIR